MAREIHYNRAQVDLHLTVELPFDSLWQLLAVALPDGKYVDIMTTASDGCVGRVRSWAKVDIGKFVVKWKQVGPNRYVLTSALVQSILHSTSVIPFVFGKGNPQALGSYRDAMNRVRSAFAGCIVEPTYQHAPATQGQEQHTPQSALPAPHSGAASEWQVQPQTQQHVAAAPAVTTLARAGAWHADPYGQARLRWHDGANWTHHVAA